MAGDNGGGVSKRKKKRATARQYHIPADMRALMPNTVAMQIIGEQRSYVAGLRRHFNGGK